MFEYLSAFEQTRSIDRPSPDFYFYLGNQKKPNTPTRIISPLGKLRIPLRQQGSLNQAQKSVNSNLPMNQQSSRLVRPSWNQVVDDLWFNEQNLQVNNDEKSSRENLNQSKNSNSNNVLTSFVNSGNKFSPQSSFDDQRFPLGNNRPNGLFTPQENRPLPLDQGIRPLPEDNEIVMPDSVLETTTLPGPPTWATPPSICVRRCPNTPEYNPVCGTDKVTYRNPGRLRCERQCGKGRISFLCMLLSLSNQIN